MLRTFGVQASTSDDIRRHRVDGLLVWERRDCGWFIHTYRFVPEQLVRVITRTDGREVPIYATAHHEREATKQGEQEGDPKRTTAFEARPSRPCLRIARAAQPGGTASGGQLLWRERGCCPRGATAISHSMSLAYAASGIVLSLA
jgi:hypothetical protein